MILRFIHLESDIGCEPGLVSVLQVENKTLFSRIVYSLSFGDDYKGSEPYVLLEGEKEVNAKDKLFLISDLVHFPLRDRQIISKLHARINELFYEDEELRVGVEQLNQSIENRLKALGFQMHADYAFGVEWDVKKYFKAFDFGVEEGEESLFDNLILFLRVASDLFPEKVLVFINLKSFIDEKDLVEFYSEVLFLDLLVLLLESSNDQRHFYQEKKILVDQDYLENF